MLGYLKSFFYSSNNSSLPKAAFTHTATDSAYLSFQKTTENPFISARNRLMILDRRIRRHAQNQDYAAFRQALHIFMSELTTLNSNISRFVITPSKKQMRLQGNTSKIKYLDTAYRKHNAIYVSLRGKCKAVLSSDSFLEKLRSLSNQQRADDTWLWSAIRGIQADFSELHDIWVELTQYENSIYNSYTSNTMEKELGA